MKPLIRYLLFYLWSLAYLTHRGDCYNQISEHIERLVQLLKGDEPSHSIDEVYNDDEVGVDAGVAPPTSKAIEAAPKEDSDDEDNIIQEI